MTNVYNLFIYHLPPQSIALKGLYMNYTNLSKPNSEVEDVTGYINLSFCILNLSISNLMEINT